MFMIISMFDENKVEELIQEFYLLMKVTAKVIFKCKYKV